MPGTVTFQPNGSAQLALPAIPIYVCLYFPQNPGLQAYIILPNIRCEQIQYKEGAEPPSARFSYVLDEIAATTNGWPYAFDRIWPLVGAPPSSYVVQTSDELAVIASMPTGTPKVLFHGYARVPQVDVSPQTQSVTFVATGIASLAYDKPLGSRPQRNGDDPFAGKVVDVDLPWRFNPAGDGPTSVGGVIPNCTPDGYDVGEAQSSPTPYPVFLDPIANINADVLSSGDGDDGLPVLWDLSRLARTILATQNAAPSPSTGVSYVQNPDFEDLETLLQNRQPLPGSNYYDPDDPSTYTTDDNTIRDYDATNKAWPVVLAELLDYYGFAMRWVTKNDSKNHPVDTFEVYRKDNGNSIAPKQVFLPPLGTSIANGANVNVGAFHAGFDFHGVANEIHLDTHPTRYEVSFILVPGFRPNTNDGLAASRTQFALSNSATAKPSIRDAYRRWIIDELGEGYYAYDSGSPSWVTQQPFDFSPIFPQTAKGMPIYVTRHRKPLGTLLSTDANGKSYPARLDISRDYAVAVTPVSPAFWGQGSAKSLLTSGSVTWQTIGSGAWNLLPDRIGIQFVCDEPWNCHIGNPPAGTPGILPGSRWPVPGGTIDLITSIANPASYVESPAQFTAQQYWLRLTVVVDGDQDLHVKALRRQASPLATTVRRRVDCRDHFSKQVIDISSAYNVPTGSASPAQIVVRDDTAAAQTFCDQMRAAHEMPALTGSVTIPTLATYLRVGDRIAEIDGRDMSMQTNAGSSQGEGPSYPFIVGVTLDFQGPKQSTTIVLSDRRVEPRAPHGY